MPETDVWVKDQLINQAQTQTKILAKLESGEKRMGRIEQSVNTVVDATATCKAVEIDVKQLKRAEELRLKAEELALKEQLEALKTKQGIWGERAWDLFKMSLPWIALAIIWTFTQMQNAS